jgi:hypothetical protein
MKRNNNYFKNLESIHKILISRYNEKVEDYRAVEKKLQQILIFNSTLIALFIQFITPIYEYFALIFYIFIFLLFFIPLIFMIYEVIPKKTTHLIPRRILNEYTLTDPETYEKILRETSTEYVNAFESLDRIINKRSYCMKFSLSLISIALLLLVFYNFYIKLYGGQ